jgi:hypothetical protein
MKEYFNLGNYSRKVSAKKKSQTWFDRGLVWLFAYNHEEAISFLKRPLKKIMNARLHFGVSRTLSVRTITNIGMFSPLMKKHQF